MRMALCPTCGNKRCPRAHNHTLACTNSNAPGQPGSSWEHVKPAAAPEVLVEAPRRCGKQTALLLALAAKACGWTVVPGSNRYDGSCNVHTGGGNTRVNWNPLTAACAMELAARLRIDVTHNHPADQDAWVCAEAVAAPGRPVSFMEDVPDEARRLECMCLAITRAAAAIGESIP